MFNNLYCSSDVMKIECQLSNWLFFNYCRRHLRNPLKTSPSASTRVFPCSLVMFFANSAMLSRMIPWNFSITCCRVRIDVWLQVLYARFADSTAACISSGVDLGTRVTTSFVAGSCKSIQSLVVESTNLPSMNNFTVGATFVVLYDRLTMFRTWKIKAEEKFSIC